MNIDNEIWKDIDDYCGLYQVSNYGNVRSLDRIYDRVCKGKNVTKNTFKKTGYFYVTLYKNKVIKKLSVHRLVAKAFIDNPNNYPCINHKDETRTNNYVDNLEWCTHKYNSNYGTNTKRAKEHYNRDIVWKKHSKSVNQYDFDMNFIKTWDRVSEIAQNYKVSKNNIYCAITGVQESACGFKWRYAI